VIHTDSVLEMHPQPVPLAHRACTCASSATILLVEDEAFVREVACDILEGEGYRVLRARNATDAKLAFRHHREAIQLLLTDVVLPGQSGPALAQELRQTSPALRTIFTSGYAENAVTRAGLAEQGMFYLPKPFSAESLVCKVKYALATRREKMPV